MLSCQTWSDKESRHEPKGSSLRHRNCLWASTRIATGTNIGFSLASDLQGGTLRPAANHEGVSGCKIRMPTRKKGWDKITTVVIKTKTATEQRGRCQLSIDVENFHKNLFWKGTTTVVYTHCRLAKFRGSMIVVKYGAVIGREKRFFVCAQLQFPG